VVQFVREILDRPRPGRKHGCRGGGGGGCHGDGGGGLEQVAAAEHALLDAFNDAVMAHGISP
jgi:hypothetical protein